MKNALQQRNQLAGDDFVTAAQRMQGLLGHPAAGGDEVDGMAVRSVPGLGKFAQLPVKRAAECAKADDDGLRRTLKNQIDQLAVALKILFGRGSTVSSDVFWNVRILSQCNMPAARL